MFIIRDLKRICFLTLALILISSCSEGRLNEVENNLENFIRKQESVKKFEISMDTISSFEWDELLIAGPYSDLNRIEENEGLNLNKVSNNIEHHDSFVLLVFIKNKKGVKWIELNSVGYFLNLIEENDGRIIFDKMDCKFVLINE